MSNESFKRIAPRGQLSARGLNDQARAVEELRRVSALGGTLVRQLGNGLQVFEQDLTPTLWIQITGGGTGGKYAFSEVIETAPATFEAVDGLSGTTSDFPAVEAAGNTAVPTDGSVYARAEVGHANDCVLFNYEGGSGSGTENVLPKWDPDNGGVGLVDSGISDDGSSITIARATTAMQGLTFNENGAENINTMVSSRPLQITGNPSIVIGTNAIGSSLAFYGGATPVVQPTVSGSCDGNAALDSLLAALASLNLVADSSTLGSALTVGTTAIASGADKQLLYDNAGTLGEATGVRIRSNNIEPKLAAGKWALSGVASY